MTTTTEGRERVARAQAVRSVGDYGSFWREARMEGCRGGTSLELCKGEVVDDLRRCGEVSSWGESERAGRNKWNDGWIWCATDPWTTVMRTEGVRDKGCGWLAERRLSEAVGRWGENSIERGGELKMGCVIIVVSHDKGDG